jgi:hypothetical protein
MYRLLVNSNSKNYSNFFLLWQSWLVHWDQCKNWDVWNVEITIDTKMLCDIGFDNPDFG